MSTSKTPKRRPSPKGWRVSAATGTGNGRWYCRIYDETGREIASPDLFASSPEEARAECVDMAHRIADERKARRNTENKV